VWCGVYVHQVVVVSIVSCRDAGCDDDCGVASWLRRHAHKHREPTQAVPHCSVDRCLQNSSPPSPSLDSFRKYMETPDRANICPNPSRSATRAAGRQGRLEAPFQLKN